MFKTAVPFINYKVDHLIHIQRICVMQRITKAVGVCVIRS